MEFEGLNTSLVLFWGLVLIFILYLISTNETVLRYFLKAKFGACNIKLNKSARKILQQWEPYNQTISIFSYIFIILLLGGALIIDININIGSGFPFFNDFFSTINTMFLIIIFSLILLIGYSALKMGAQGRPFLEEVIDKGYQIFGILIGVLVVILIKYLFISKPFLEDYNIWIRTLITAIFLLIVLYSLLKLMMKLLSPFRRSELKAFLKDIRHEKKK